MLLSTEVYAICSHTVYNLADESVWDLVANLFCARDQMVSPTKGEYCEGEREVDCETEVSCEAKGKLTAAKGKTNATTKANIAKQGELLFFFRHLFHLRHHLFYLFLVYYFIFLNVTIEAADGSTTATTKANIAENCMLLCVFLVYIYFGLLHHSFFFGLLH